MGIRIYEAEFLLRVIRNKQAELGRCLTLGRQNIFFSKSECSNLVDSCGVPGPISDHNVSWLTDDTGGNVFAEGFLKALGATSVDSMDVSDYEGATVLHDLNNAIPAHLTEQFDSVIDLGVAEHVFNVSIAMHNSLRMAKIGGYYLAILPANNTAGHGFYQFSPELFYSLLTEKNGMEKPLVVAREMTPRGRFRIIPNPAHFGDRVLIENWRELYLFIVSKKIASTPEVLDVSQSDYVVRWAQSAEHQTKPIQKNSIIRFLKPFLQNLPDFLLFIGEMVLGYRRDRLLHRFPYWTHD